jgi:hypothetical protein
VKGSTGFRSANQFFAWIKARTVPFREMAQSINDMTQAKVVSKPQGATLVRVPVQAIANRQVHASWVEFRLVRQRGGCQVHGLQNQPLDAFAQRGVLVEYIRGDYVLIQILPEEAVDELVGAGNASAAVEAVGPGAGNIAPLQQALEEKIAGKPIATGQLQLGGSFGDAIEANLVAPLQWALLHSESASGSVDRLRGKSLGDQRNTLGQITQLNDLNEPTGAVGSTNRQVPPV